MKKRLDVLLTEKGLAASREKAKAIIMSGVVFVNGIREDKAGSTFDENLPIEIRGNTLKYVSRGGLKLEKAVRVFAIDLDGKNCLDVGSSTGGFTDCMLQSGAAHVVAIDVGRGQLDWKLRGDPRVTCMEKTNIRYVLPGDIEYAADFSSIDVSFISLVKVLLPVRELLTENGRVVCLLKPQFEAGREKVGKHGVVRDRKVHSEVIRKVLGYAESIGFTVLGLDYSPIKGPEGNIEYLAYLSRSPGQSDELTEDTEKELTVDAEKEITEDTEKEIPDNGNTRNQWISGTNFRKDAGGITLNTIDDVQIENIVDAAHAALDKTDQV